MRHAVVRPAAVAAALVLAGCTPSVVVMSYNVRNLFDTRVDGTEYAGEELPDIGLLKKKCEVLAGALRDACPGGPDIVALQEIENLDVLLGLRDGWLRGMGYRYCLAAGGPRTAVRVGFLSRHPILAARTHQPAPVGDEQPRAILEIECSVRGVPLHVFNNHWKSRIGGLDATEPSRVRSAQVVARRVRSLLARDPGAEVIVLGDMNEDPVAEVGSGSIARGGAPAALGRDGGPPGPRPVLAIALEPVSETLTAPGQPLCLYEPWLEKDAPEGSYAYGGSWGRPDHLLMSFGLLDGRGLRYRAGSFRSVTPAYLLDKVTGLPRGAVERGAEVYPDHLPMVVVLDPVQGPSSP